MGWSAGFTFRNVGGVGMLGGSWRPAAEMADCTSCAAASRLRERSNWMVTWVAPRKELELMLETPAMVANCPSSGVATDEAMVSGLAPGRLALTWMVGKSTLGRSLTGRARYAVMPNSRIASMTSVVITGRRINSSAIFTNHYPGAPAARWR